MHYCIKIADLIISVSKSSEELYHFLPKEIEPFISNNESEVDASIKLYYRIPDEFSKYDVLFYAEKGPKYDDTDLSPYCWCVCKTGNNNHIRIYMPGSIDKPDIITAFDKKAKNWKIFLSESYCRKNDFNADPFIYPLGPLIFYYIISRNNCIMIHSSGVFDGNKGYLFCGRSGSGKTTISKIWHSEKAIIINDDRIIARKKADGYFIYNTPMNYRDESKKAPLDMIFLLCHSAENYATKINGAEAVARLMSNCIQHNYDSKLIKSVISFSEDICGQIPVYELGFVPNQCIADFVRNFKFT
jgi:hypothetical protein